MDTAYWLCGGNSLPSQSVPILQDMLLDVSSKTVKVTLLGQEHCLDRNIAWTGTLLGQEHCLDRGSKRCGGTSV
ncbi:MAG: hypothetical protein M1483_04045 [Actinobacteria bacterium]|nr:hypothetical protein [Actinomycetota bacterium]MCL6104791.1 hypothetical protein [Actinomycetota bacterium]